MEENTNIPEDKDLTEEDFALLKNVRNSFLTSSDKYMLMGDLPEPLKNKIIAYRDTIRNIDSKFGKEWVKQSHVQWPEVPSELLSHFNVPLVAPPGATFEV